MTRRRKILLGLLVIAVGIMVAGVIWPDVWLEYLFYIYSVPVMIVNMWEGFEPEIMEKLFGRG
jgi:hypothetical protein